MILKRGIHFKVLKPVLYVVYLFFIVFILLEILLRIYNPFEFRLKGERIILPVNQRQIITNKINPRLESTITNTRNTLGLRGEDPPANLDEYLSIITVGGSTTECHFLNDHKTWPYLLGENLGKQFRQVWLNNAGLDGHSTFGHQVLLNDHLVRLHPKVILLLTGVNDIENDAPTFHDKLNTRGQYPDLLHYLYNESEVINIVINLLRGARAQKFNNTTQELFLPGSKGILKLDNKSWMERLRNQDKFLDAYESRLLSLIDTCKKHSILPVFMSQPTLYGMGVDSLTGINLETADVGNGMNGKLLYELLQLYNNRMKKICGENDVPFIDLAVKMPKNSWYYYDALHFTNQGAAIVASTVYEELAGILKNRFPEYYTGKN